MKRITVLLSLFGLLGLCFSFFLKHENRNSLNQKLLLDQTGQMWNGGKPGLSVQVNKIDDNLKVATALPCDSVRVSLKGIDGVELNMADVNYEAACMSFTEFTIPLQYTQPERGTGYIVAQVSVVAGGAVQSMSKAFAVDGVEAITEKVMPTSVDQNGVKYHEFSSTIQE